MSDEVSKRFKKAIEKVERFLFSCSQPNVKAVDYFGAAEESAVTTGSHTWDIITYSFHAIFYLLFL